MTGKTEARLREIRSRTKQYRKKYENRLLTCLAMCNLILFAGIGVLMGVLGAAIGNFCGLGMGVILHFFV